MKTTLIYKIKFTNYWLFQDSNSDKLLKNHDGLPFISAKSIKGILRNKLLECGCESCFIETIIITDAVTKINEKNENVVKSKFFTEKQLINTNDPKKILFCLPMTLEGTINGLSKKQELRLKEVIKQIKYLGQFTQLGYGSCVFYLSRK